MERGYDVVLSQHADRQLTKLPPDIQVRLTRRLRELASEPRGRGVTALQGLKGAYRVRVGDYRIVFEVVDAERRVKVQAVGHRRQVYDR